MNKELKYQNAWDVLQIQSEFVAAIERLQNIKNAVAIYGSARIKENDPLYKSAREMGSLVALNGYPVITGGGPGVMEAANRGAFEAGGHSIGLGIRLPHEEGLNLYAHEGMMLKYFFVRKTMFENHSCGFIVCPGGFGTLDELSEIVTLVQTKKLKKSPIVLFDSNYWKELVDWIRGPMTKRGMISKGDHELLHITDNPLEAVSIALQIPIGELKR